MYHLEVSFKVARLYIQTEFILRLYAKFILSPNLENDFRL